MKEIIVYQTEDNCRFDHKEDAINYENNLKRCNDINSRLINIGRELNYNEYIQQDINVVKNAFCDFMDIVAKTIPTYAKWANQVKTGERHISHIGRVLSDFDIKCFNKLYYRFICIDFNNGKEFQQPYLVNNQHRATIKVN